MDTRRVLVSGAGVAGLACATMLDKEKYEVDLIDQAPQFRNIGFSIMLWRAGFRILTDLLSKNNVPTEEGKDYFHADAFDLYAGLRLQFVRSLDAKGYGWAFERQRLLELLEQAARNQLPPERIAFSRSVRHIEYDHDNDTKALVTFRDGTQKLYDIVIVAEGIHSTSRELVGVNELVDSVPYALRYAWFSSPTNLQAHGGLFFTVGQVAVIHPPFFKNVLGFYFDKGVSRDEQNAFERTICELVRQPDGRQASLNTQTSDIFELKEVHLDRYWSKNVVFVGDSAHGRPPTLGFGTSLALEDAWCLAKELNALIHPNERELERALKTYSDTRKKRVDHVYAFQDRMIKFYTRSKIKIAFLALIVHTIYARYLEMRMKWLIGQDVFTD